MKALVAAGYFNLPRFHTEIADWDHDQDGYPVPAKNAKKEMSPSRMAYLLIERYIGRQGAYNNKRKTYDWKPGLLDPDSMMSGARPPGGLLSALPRPRGAVGHARHRLPGLRLPAVSEIRPAASGARQGCH
ncbi:hypothetical protein [Aeromonas veronii]|uniref:hypothetical protein n=1 Tax=Aeromonas veronii TaxID=654 RepID=UPI001F0AA103|nr:hypothetical protein [Aeromonas veronii]